MKKLMLSGLLVLAWVALCAAQTPSPSPTGNLLWSRDITVYAARGGDVLVPVSNATVTAVGVTTATTVTNSSGQCHIEVTAHDTGSVTVTITASNLPTATRTYPGLPAAGTASIYMDQPTSPAGVFMVPSTQTVITGAAFTTEIHASTGNQLLAAYGITLSWNVPAGGALFTVDTVEAGAQGFVGSFNAQTPGQLVIAGFDTVGKGPGANLHIATIRWKAGTIAGSTAVNLTIQTLVDPNYNTISAPSGNTGTINVTAGLAGDVNGDGAVTIVDALIVAQYSVGLSVAVFNATAADVTKDGVINIVDALRIAQYYVGLISSL